MNKKDFFDGIAPQWEKEHRLQKETARLAQLVRLIPLSRGQQVLDVGCGPGRLVPFIRDAIGEKGLILESDFSAEMLKIGKRKYYCPPLFFVQADAQILPLKNDLFDIVICFALFPHIPDKLRALREFRRVLKPGGPLFVCHPMSREELNKFHAQVKGPVTEDFLPDCEEMDFLFSSSGFHGLFIRDEPSLYIASALA